MKVTESWPRELLQVLDYVAEIIARKVQERMLTTNNRTPNPVVRANRRLKSRSSVARFSAELVDNQIPGVQLRAALARDVHRACAAWCRRAGESHVEPLNRLMPSTKGKRARKRWELHGRKAGPHSVVFLVKAMGACAERVRELAETGQLGSDSIKLLVTELGKLRAGAATAELGDFDSQLTKIKDEAREFLNTIAKSGALDFFREKIAEVNAEISDASRSGKLKELAKSISDGIIATGQAIGSAISFVSQYAGALLQLGRAYAVFKTADFVAGLVRSAGGLATAAAAAKKASGDVEGAAGSFGRLGAAIGKIPKQVQFAVVAVAVDFALNQIEKLVAVTQEYLEVHGKHKDIQADAAGQQEALASKAKAFADLFKSSADVQIASADELAAKCRLQSAAYVDQLQNATRYYTALRIQLKAAGDDEGVAALTTKLRELGVALGAAQAALESAGGSIAASTGAFARDAVHAWDRTCRSSIRR